MKALIALTIFITEILATMSIEGGAVEYCQNQTTVSVDICLIAHNIK